MKLKNLLPWSGRHREALGEESMHCALQRAKLRGTEVRTIIDVGAAKGKWTRTALQSFPDANVLAFEPLQERHNDLTAMKNKHPRFDFVMAAASAGPATLHYLVTDDLDGSSVPNLPANANREVPATTVDLEIEKRDKLRGPYLLKLDTHGFEIPILSGASRTLQSSNLVVIEAYNFRVNDGVRFYELCQKMEDLGFLPVDVVEPLRRPGDRILWQIDIFFEPKASLSGRAQSYGGHGSHQ